MVRMIGRPSSYTHEMGERICAAVASSKYGLRRVLKDDPELPAYGCVLGWIDSHVDFASSLALARRVRLKGWAEDIIDISDDDTIDPADKRIMVDTRKWLLSKEMNMVYGDKLDVTSGGEALAAPAHQIDARVQSIIMQAHERKVKGVALADEALRLLE